jgi:hypothetical protein
MSATHKTRRWTRDICASLGIEIEFLREGRHTMWKMTNRHGVVKHQPGLSDPGDGNRATRNWVSQLKRFSEQTE